MEKKVKVLLSTYNGEKYIQEQIESILNQTYSNIEIIVRDDGSKDKTVEILKEYEKERKITLYLGENKGFISSFFELLQMEDGADYYAFSDQDDIWKPDKIERAVTSLDKKAQTIPLLYTSSYEICDELGNVVSKAKKVKNISFANALVECIAPGMTMVINQTARGLVISKETKQCYYHDWWIYLVCVATGQVIYDDYESVKYRRHIDSVTNIENNIVKRQLWRIQQIFQKQYFKKTKQQIRFFYQQYERELSVENKKIIKPFLSVYSFKKVIYPKPYRNGIGDEILLRILFFINII